MKADGYIFVQNYGYGQPYHRTAGKFNGMALCGAVPRGGGNWSSVVTGEIVGKFRHCRQCKATLKELREIMAIRKEYDALGR